MTGRVSEAQPKETLMRTTLMTLATILTAGAALAQMNHGATMDHGAMPAGEGAMDHGAMMDGVHAPATLNSIGDGTVNVSHGPIAAIGWPAMTMDMPLLQGADVGDVQPGDSVTMMLEKGPDGMYGVKGLSKTE
jgi:Cu/Ag efflux protein CusF